MGIVSSNKLINFFRSTCKSYFRLPFIFQDLYKYKDNTSVILFTDNSLLWPTYSPKHKIGNTIHESPKIKVSLISSIKNEKDNIICWLERICAQTYKPDEIIIVDGGSTDGSFEILKAQKSLFPIPIQIHSNSGGNIAQSRNIAISLACNEIIAVTDFGCLPAYDWLEKILTPFSIDPEIVVSAGIYDPIYPTRYPLTYKKLWLWGDLLKIKPQTYLPPGGSSAFQKKAWHEIGGYPEWLTLTGEDTLFDLKLKQLGGKWAFVPEAVVEWNAPKNYYSFIIKLFHWATGDGEMKNRGIFFWRYSLLLITTISLFILFIIFPILISNWFNKQLISIFYLVIFFLIFLGLRLWSIKNNLPEQLFMYKVTGSLAQFFGYINGSSRQDIINLKRYKKNEGIVILLSGVPIDDTGGGARCTQLSMEFLRRNYVVIYLYRFPRNETKDLDIQIHHPNLIEISIVGLNYKHLLKSFQRLIKSKKNLTIIEHPIPDFLPIVKYIKKLGGTILYDKIDEWDTSLGGNWYSKNVEKKFIKQSQILTATVPLLAIHLNQVSGRNVHLISNAFNPLIFNPDSNFKFPKDMPEGAWTGIYIGALWGNWFDWILLREIAETYPNAVFPIIGDISEIPRSFPKNVHFLGLKKQCEIPAYLKFSNVAMIPWYVNKITQATSPLKAYEFVAMRLPIVAPRLEPLNNFPGIYQALDRDDFVNSLDFARKKLLEMDLISTFLVTNNWEYRTKQILDLL